MGNVVGVVDRGNVCVPGPSGGPEIVENVVGVIDSKKAPVRLTPRSGVLEDHTGVEPDNGSQLREVEAGDLSPPISVKGRLQANLSFWKEELQASSYVLGTIESGYVFAVKI